MSLCNTKTVKLFFSCIFFMIISVSSHAMEKEVLYENTVIVGKEYMFIGSDSENNDTLQAQNSQPKIFIGDSSSIVVVENTKIFIDDSLSIADFDNAKIVYDEENWVDNGNIQPMFAKTDSKTNTKTDEPVKNDNTENVAPEEIVVPDFPFDSSSLSYSYSSKESAIPVPQQRLNEYQAVCKVNRENAFPGIENSDLSLYLPEQKQKLSTLATQCGMLTLISPNSPPLL